MAPIKIDFVVDVEKIEEHLRHIIKIVKPEWKQHQIKFEPISGGLSNILMLCYREQLDDSVMFRINGPEEGFIDRQAEREAFRACHNNDLGAELLAYFENGLAYTFLRGDVLTTDTIKAPEMVPLLCDSIAKLHSISEKSDETPWIWSILQKFLDKLPARFEEPEIQQRYEEEIGGAVFLKEEAKALKAKLNRCSYPLVFSHNDIIPANCIFLKEEKKIKFIDLELFGYNYQPYDIGLHFLEYSGTSDIDYDRVPNQQYQLTWITKYLTRYRQYTGSDAPVTDSEVFRFYVAANQFALTGHLLAICWSIYQIKHSTIDFDYLQYALTRLKDYREKRKWIDVPEPQI